MDCQRNHELLSPFVDGELPLDLARPMMAHMVGCARCRAEAEALRSLGVVVREMGERVPTGLIARVVSEARAAHESPRHLVLGIVSAWPRAAAMVVGAASMALFLSPLTSAPALSPISAALPSGFHLLVSESQAELELAGSFSGDFRVLARRPEGRLMYDLTGGR